jgi:hypothetical protein
MTELMTELALKILREVIIKADRDKLNPKLSLVIDYPKEAECIISESYCFRIGAAARLKDVEVSINGDSWHRCRSSEGYWWYDWHGYLPGAKFLLARATTPDGEKVITYRRRFTVR